MTQNWEVNINFKVSGKGKDLYGDGFAIWYARDRLVPGPVFGSKDHFMGLAIILDTYSNHNGPHNVCVTCIRSGFQPFALVFSMSTNFLAISNSNPASTSIH